MSTSKEKVLEFLKINMSQDAINTMLEVAKKYVSGDDEMPDEIWDDYKNLYDVNELYRRLTPIYQEYFTDDDLDFIIEFLKNPKSEKYVNLITNTETYSKVSSISMAYMTEIISVVTLKMQNGGYGDF